MLVGHLSTYHQAQNTPSVGSQGVMHQSTWLPCAAKNAWPLIHGAMCPSIHLLATVFMHHPGAPSSSPIEFCVYQVACVLAHSLCKIYITPVTESTFARWASLAFRLAHSSWSINTCLNDPYSTNLAPPVVGSRPQRICRQYRGRLARLPPPSPLLSANQTICKT